MKIKVFFGNIVNKIKISGIMDEAKDYIRDNLKMGSVVEVLDKSQDKFYTCPQGYPPEYCTKENIVQTFIVKTITDEASGKSLKDLIEAFLEMGIVAAVANIVDNYTRIAKNLSYIQKIKIKIQEEDDKCLKSKIYFIY